MKITWCAEAESQELAEPRGAAAIAICAAVGTRPSTLKPFAGPDDDDDDDLDDDDDDLDDDDDDLDDEEEEDEVDDE